MADREQIARGFMIPPWRRVGRTVGVAPLLAARPGAIVEQYRPPTCPSSRLRARGYAACFATEGEKVAAVVIGMSAAAMPVRPSSNRTWVSMYWVCLPL